MNFAPVVVFCYTRLHYLKRVIAALQKNAEASETEIFFYSDGGKDQESWQQVHAVRDYIRKIQGFKNVFLIEQTENRKLEFNVIQGITEVVNRFGRVIVLEDDILPSKYFLKFMNDSLDFYQDRKEVMGVSAYNFLKFPKNFPETFAWRYDGGWGWCTWKDRWAKFQYFKNRKEAFQYLTEADALELEFGGVFHCLNCLDLNPATWDISWYICVFLNGVCISPSHSLTKHIGEEGTHFHINFLQRIFRRSSYSAVRFSDRKITYLTNDIDRNYKAEELFRKYHEKFAEKTFLRKIYSVLKQIKNKLFQRKRIN